MEMTYRRAARDAHRAREAQQRDKHDARSPLGRNRAAHLAAHLAFPAADVDLHRERHMVRCRALLRAQACATLAKVGIVLTRSAHVLGGGRPPLPP